MSMPPTTIPQRPRSGHPALSRAARLLGGFVLGALPGLVLLAGPSFVTGDVEYSVLLPAAFAIALLALPIAAWTARRRGRPGFAVWVLVGVALGVLFSLAVWLLLLARAAGGFAYMPGRVGLRVVPLYG